MRKKIKRRTFLQAGAILGGAGVLTACGQKSESLTPDTVLTESAAESTAQSEAESAAPQEEEREYRAMWFSYLDWALCDFSSESAFRASAGQMLENCVALGLNTIIAQVRPFGDAMYPSELFPWSHICTGTQGKDPGFDPLQVLLEESHSRSLELEAWVNPYRVRQSDSIPPNLADDSLYALHPEWCVQVDKGIYLNPAITEAADYVVQGVAEILENYAVDGIHFDDYFYPTTETYIDETQYAAEGNGVKLEDWRRQNVTALVQKVHDAVKSADPAVRFGISPQGNPDNNYGMQYSDVAAWIDPQEGEAPVDYICPQLYWGYHYTLKNGSTRFAYENISREWAALPRQQGVKLFFGLGAFRVGTGDGGHNEDSGEVWQTGHALADMIEDGRALKTDGYVLYRYASLFDAGDNAWAEAECEAISAENS